MTLSVSLLSAAKVKIEAEFSVESVTAAFQRALKRLGASAMAEIAGSGNQDPRYEAIRTFVLDDYQKKALREATEKYGLVENKYTRPLFFPSELPQEGRPLNLSVVIYVMNAAALSFPRDANYDPRPSLFDVPAQVIENYIDVIDFGRRQTWEREGLNGPKPASIRLDPKALALAKDQITHQYHEYVKLNADQSDSKV